MCSRMLYTILPSPYSDENLNDVLEDLSSDLLSLYREWWDVKDAVKNIAPNHDPGDVFKPGWVSPLRNLPTADDPKYIRIDPAHTYAIDGIGKSYLASSIILLMHMGWFGNGPIDDKFKNAFSRFMAYCEAHGKNTSITEFSHKVFKLPQNSLNGYPAGLGKGHDAAVVSAWLDEELCSAPATFAGPQFNELLEVLRWSSNGINRFWRLQYNAGLWVTRADTELLVRDCFIFCDEYSTLATLCARAGYPLFKIRPKLHMMCHLGLDLKHALLQYPDAQWFLSISTYMTWSDEDFIGRISRISRRTSPLTAADRTITRALALYRRQWIATFGRAYANVD
ncbi:unnamed protein product [Cladocopium goreaui]|uniref:Uncharacterized protein n=1 Tax=Cladocopium goreaui TaxID=2562237 RepID=A0A9P1BTU2_9DINO|nr:unnamed protein product [Cladocopium goreaui]